MSDVFRFAVLGLGAGALYAIAAVGLVLVYRGSGVVNFAQGAMGMVAAYVFYDARQRDHLPALVAVALGLLTSAAVGAAFHFLVLRRMRNASMLAKIVATLALLVVLQDVTLLRYGSVPQIVTSMLPTGPVRLLGVDVGEDRLYIFGIVVVLTAVLWLVYRYTAFGIATTAVAENPTAASSLGISPHLVAGANWAIGAALGGLAAILLVPITSLSSDLLSLIVIPILAAAVVGRFSSFPVTMLAGIGIGVAQSEVTRWVNAPGWATAVPFAFVILSVVRGRPVSGRGEPFARMPGLGDGRLSFTRVVTLTGVALLCIWVVFPSDWLAAAQLQLVVAIALLSFFVVAGLGGQLSLVQMGFAGIAAVVASRLYNLLGWPFEWALVAGVLSAIPVGMILGLAAARARGVQLAIVTLGLAYSLDAVVFGNPAYTPGLGFLIRPARLFGLDVDPSTSPKRYATVSLLLLLLVVLMVSNLRRGRAGRRLVAVRTNERAAMALGLGVTTAKTYAFVLGGLVASLSGVLLAFDPLLLGSSDYFGGFQSIALMQLAVFGGVGHVGGPLIVSTLQGGSVGQEVFSFLGARAGFYLSLVAAGGLLLMLPVASDGLAALLRSLLTRAFPGLWGGAARRSLVSVPEAAERGPADGGAASGSPAGGKVLRVVDLSVRYGAFTALAGLSLEVHPGEVVGMIGPNGSGKTTAIDAITGFAAAAGGTLTLGGVTVNRWTAQRRAQAGLSRSFQSLELFDDLTVLENIQAACDRRDLGAYVTDLFLPGRAMLTARARVAVEDLGLADHLGTQARQLSYAQRRLLAVARAAAGGGSVLLLDEPASGLSEPETVALSEAIRRLASRWGVGVLLVEHNVDMVLRTCDRVVALDFGTVIGDGTPGEIRQNPAVVAAYLGTARFHRRDPEPAGAQPGGVQPGGVQAAGAQAVLEANSDDAR